MLRPLYAQRAWGGELGVCSAFVGYKAMVRWRGVVCALIYEAKDVMPFRWYCEAVKGPSASVGYQKCLIKRSEGMRRRFGQRNGLFEKA